MRLQLTALGLAARVLLAPGWLVAQDPTVRGAAASPDAGRARRVVEAAVEVAGYTDTDHVNVASPGVSATVSDPTAGWSVGGRYMVDAVSAASVDIVSTASSKWSERRHVGSGQAAYKPGAVGASVSGGVSREPDYLSIGLGATLEIDLLDKNLTPFFGLSYGHDDVGRTGLDPARWRTLQRGALRAGATFVVDASTIAGIQLDADFERGDLAKPYRYVAVFAPGTAGSVPSGASPALVDHLREPQRPIERLPGARDRFALTGRVARRLGRTTLRLDERGYTDSWGLWASTTDARAMVDVGRRLTLWPHLRYHTQTAVRFWQRAYEVVALPDGGVGLPSYRAGDRELSWLSTVTFGGGMSVRLPSSPRRPWTLSFQIDAARTGYPDALFVTHRWSLFSAVTLGAEWR